MDFRMLKMIKTNIETFNIASGTPQRLKYIYLDVYIYMDKKMITKLGADLCSHPQTDRQKK